MTNWVYFCRNPESYQMTAEPAKAIRLADLDHDDRESQRSESVGSKLTNQTRQARQALGYSSIPQDLLERSCVYLAKWISDYMPSDNVNHFPTDIVFNHGELVFKIIESLGKREPPGKVKIDSSMKKNEKVEALYGQYSALINDLKEQGCLLNTIRPEF